MKPFHHKEALPVNLIKYGEYIITLKNIFGAEYKQNFEVFVSGHRIGKALSEFNRVNYFLKDPKNLLLEQYISYYKHKRGKKRTFPYSGLWVLEYQEKLLINRG